MLSFHLCVFYILKYTLRPLKKGVLSPQAQMQKPHHKHLAILIILDCLIVLFSGLHFVSLTKFFFLTKF